MVVRYQGQNSINSCLQQHKLYERTSNPPLVQNASSLGEQLENILEPKPLVESEVVGELGIAQVDVYCGKGLDPHDEVVGFHCGGYSECLRRFQHRDHHEICTAQQTAALFHKSDSHVAAVGMFGLDGRWLADV